MLNLNIINLTEGFDPFEFPSLEVPCKSFKFPGGEIQVKIDAHHELQDHVVITSRLTNSDELIKLCLAVDALRRMVPETKISAFIPYLPYARQDRVCDDGEALSLVVVARILNSLNLHRIISFDVHSEVSGAVINNLVNVSNIWFFKSIWKMLFEGKEVVLISPDAGANKKVFKLSEYLGVEMLTAMKHRDVKTGKITKTTIENSSKFESDECQFIVVDDICDGGRTFIELAKTLDKCGVLKEQLSLVVTHGILSNGFEELSKYYHNICFTSSFRDGLPFKEFYTLENLIDDIY